MSAQAIVWTLLAVDGAGLLAIAVQILVVDRRAWVRFAAAVDPGPVTQEIPTFDTHTAMAEALLTPDAPIPGRYTPGRPLTDWEAAEWAWMSRALAARTGDDRD